MGLIDKLNAALKKHDLYAESFNQTDNVKEELPELSYKSLDEIDIDSIAEDDFGTKVVIVKEIEYSHLPMRYGKYYIEDIQKLKSGLFEIHLLSW